MPLAADNHLDQLYARQRLLQDEAARLEGESEELEAADADPDRRYLLDIQSRALRLEATSLASRISDILERDLQR